MASNKPPTSPSHSKMLYVDRSVISLPALKNKLTEPNLYLFHGFSSVGNFDHELGFAGKNES